MEYYFLYNFIFIVLITFTIYYLIKRKVMKDYIASYSQLKSELEKKTVEIKQMLNKQNKFWSVITHELKNVFYSFYNSIDLLNSEYDQLTEEERKILAQNIGNSYNYTITVINDLMEWSKVNRQLQKPSFESFNLRVVVDEIIAGLEDKLSGKELKVIKKTEDNLYIYADRMMIGYVVKNVLNNAIKFSNLKGEIKVTSTKKTNSVSLYLEDNGVGISRENLSRIFNIDEIFSTPGTNKEKGTGLGLMICMDFVELNNGTIKVESEEGKYTRVIISLPSDN